MPSRRIHAAATSFLALFSIVGLALYGLPLFYDHMVREFGWSRTQVTSGNAISKLLVGPLVGFIAGWAIDRFGPRRLMLAGIALAGAALIGLGSMTALWMFYAFYILNALGYVCGGPLPNQVLLSRWFREGRGKAMGVAYLGIGLGGAAVPWLAYGLTNLWGWRGALRAIGVLIVVLAWPMAWLAKDAPDELGPEREDGAATTAAGTSAAFGPVLRSPAFYMLAAGSMCSIAAVGGANQHLKLFLGLDQGYAQGEATQIISLVLSCSIAGRLLMGWLADRWPTRRVMLLIYLLVAGAIPLLYAATSRPAMYLFAAMFGLGLGGEYLIIPLMAAELFGVAVLGRVMGLIVTADGVAEAVSPMLVGYLRDANGSYGTGFALLVAVALAGAVAIARLPAAPEKPPTATR
jgi:MFS family permease